VCVRVGVPLTTRLDGQSDAHERVSSK
jgi:hypothetical protein